jgi:hypothetical protein
VASRVDQSPVEKVRQWERSGAATRIVALSAAHAVVELCACTGETMERLSSDDPELLHMLAGRPAAVDAGHVPPELADPLAGERSGGRQRSPEHLTAVVPDRLRR